jgi:hypothetical protein
VTLLCRECRGSTNQGRVTRPVYREKTKDRQENAKSGAKSLARHRPMNSQGRATLEPVCLSVDHCEAYRSRDTKRHFVP